LFAAFELAPATRDGHIAIRNSTPLIVIVPVAMGDFYPLRSVSSNNEPRISLE
jgi:hypothetical protein